jgi:lipopolysaccharide/colanic/teichoic acid biosynthesis glycosyltransferase
MTPTARTAARPRTAIHTTPVPRLLPPIQRPSESLYARKLKRWFDLAFSALSLPVVIPVALFVAVIIKLDSPGPVLVKLDRLGRGGVLIGQYKFRTMVVDAERVLRELLESDPQIRREFETTFKIRQDPRVTTVGRWLRKTSLDELPQILNVLKGEMSWVGPRAIRPDELKMYDDWAPMFLSAVPGITGIWQVSGRSKLSYAERVRLDIHYIETISCRSDLGIILKTVPVMFTGDGAF